MAKSNIPQISIRDSLIELRCSICKNILSIPPITIISGAGNEYKCGRCSFVKTQVNMPAVLFEKLASTVTFPCIFPNCKAEIQWNDVKSHEESCIHRPFVCFCRVTMEIKEVQKHFTDRHPDKIGNNNFFLGGLGGPERLQTSLILKDTVPFLVYIFKYGLIHNCEYRVGVYNLLDTGDKQYKFKINITDKKQKCFRIFDQSVVKYNARQHCPNCLLGTCQISNHKYRGPRVNLVLNMMRTQIDYTSLHKLTNYSVISPIPDLTTLCLSLSVECHNPALLEATFAKNEELRKAWECPICQEYMTPPIFLCATGHSLCGTCKGKVALCPFCKLGIGKLRNYTLEEIAAGPAQLRCQYESKGCLFGGNVVEVAEHERNCDKALSSAQTENEKKKKETTEKKWHTSESESESEESE